MERFLIAVLSLWFLGSAAAAVDLKTYEDSITFTVYSSRYVRLK
jgi:hypothetical protein